MHILHIAGSYGGTEVYRNLVENIDKLGIQQTVFVPLNANNHERVGNHMINFKTDGSSIIYSTSLKKCHRFFYKAKIRNIARRIYKMVDLSTIDLIHCGNLCADAGVAYIINKRLSIPYISAVRNTDIYTYFKIFKWYRRFFIRIAEASKALIFISPSHRNFFENKYLRNCNLSGKIHVIPNGIDNSYFTRLEKSDSIYLKDKTCQYNLIFASAFLRSKSLYETILAVDKVRKKTGLEIYFTAYGKGLPFRKTNHKYVALLEDFSKDHYWCKIEDFLPKERLRIKYSESDIFIMPSSPETFGLVYVEAMSQGIPIIYGKGQGFDGYFQDGEVGYAAVPFDIDDIAQKIELAIQNLEVLKKRVISIKLANIFSWQILAERYMNLYLNCLK